MIVSPYLIIACIALLTYLPILANGFVGDDFFRIVENLDLQRADFYSLSQLVLYPGDIYRPVMTLLQASSIKLFGLNPLPLHLLSLLLHSLVCVLGFKFLKQLIDTSLAFWAMILFAVHPLHSEAVANISAQSELLAAVFLLASLLICLSDSRSRLVWLPSLIVCSFCAYASKESSLVLLLIAPVALVVKKKHSQIVPVVVSLSLAVCMYFGLRVSVLGFDRFAGQSIPFTDNPLVQLSLLQRFPYVLESLGQYLLLTILPFPLRSDYSFAYKNIEPLSLMSLEFVHILVFTVFCLLFLRAIILKRNYLVWYYWFIASFVVTANLLFATGTIFAERLAYLPSLGVIVLITNLLWFKTQGIWRKLLLFSVSFIFIFASITRSFAWRNNYTLAAADIKTTAESARVQYNYGIALQHQEQFVEAEKHLFTALSIYPALVEAAHALAINALKQSDSEKTESWLEHAYGIDSSHVPTLLHLGTLRANQGKLEQAESLLVSAHRQEPNDFDIQLAFLGLYINQGNFDIAKQVYEKLINKKPQYGELKRLGSILDEYSK